MVSIPINGNVAISIINGNRIIKSDITLQLNRRN